MHTLGLADAPVLGNERARIDHAQGHLASGRPRGKGSGEIGNLEPARKRRRTDRVRRIEILQLDPAKPVSSDDCFLTHLELLYPGMPSPGLAKGEFQTRAAGDSDYMPVGLGAVRLYEAGKAPARRLTARYGCGLKLVVHEVDLRVLILERPKAEG